jgi:ubiquinone/menaquinone biosynthesis C-methylase UbiE
MKTEERLQEDLVSKAFSDQSVKFDAITTTNPMEVWYRNFSRAKVLSYLKVDESLLELNCGTGLDAVFFAQQGLKVMATDNSEGMVQQCREKIKHHHLQNQIDLLRCSFNDLSPLPKGKTYNHVFSNFGGLNCSEDLSVVIKQVDAHLKKGAMVHWVMIAPLCPWEWLSVFKGRFSYAFRRLNKKGVESKIDGNPFMTYYYSSAYVKRHFGENYRLAQLHGMGCFLPPTYKEHFPKQWPRLFALMKGLEKKLSGLWPFNRFGDLYLISLQKIRD